MVATGSAGLLPTAAAATGGGGGPSATLSAAFHPLRLGAATTVTFGVKIDPPRLTGPTPLNEIEVSYPNNLGLATSGLGLESCDPGALEAIGRAACPADSKMGTGTAVVEVPFGPTIISEQVQLDTYAAPSTDGYLHLAILAHGQEPVLASVILTGILLPGRLRITVPPIASLPGAPNIALVSMRATLGGALTYYERRGRRRVAYRPRGIGLPDRCPRGGWKVAARFAFVDGLSSHASTSIACPTAHSKKH